MASTINASNSGFGGIVSTGDSSGQLQLQTANTTAVTIDTSQQVGIGTTSGGGPYYKFHVQMPSDGSTGVGFRYIGGTNNPGMFFNVNESTRVSAINASGSTSGILAFQTDNVERMRIDNNGNVGIGVTPSSWGSGSQAIQNSSGSIWQYGSSNIYVGQNYYFNGTNRIYSTTAEASEYQQGAGLHRWFSAGSGTAGTTLSLTERMRITSDGTVRINCANYSTGPSSTSNGLALESNGGYPFWNHANTGTGLTTYYAFINGNGVVGTIRTTGSSTQFNTSSDYRLKENVHPMVGALDKVAQLNPVTYTWKTDGSAGQGFIAHELAEVVPECVSGEKDAVNEDGSINPQGIDTSHLVATLTAAIKEQQTIINDLKARIETLESK